MDIHVRVIASRDKVDFGSDERIIWREMYGDLESQSVVDLHML